MNEETVQPWDDARIREAFIDDGGQAEYYDPINGAKEQRRIAGDIFDRWLAAHDAEVRAGAVAEKSAPSVTVLTMAPGKSICYCDRFGGAVHAFNPGVLIGKGCPSQSVPEPQAEPSDTDLSNVSINGVRQTWQQMYEREHEAHVELQGYRTMLSDLDRNASGRHEGDYDTKATGNGGISAGNPHLPTGTVIGYDIGGREYVVPEPRDRGTLSAWVRAAGGVR